jgi:hypothetical protein
MSIIRTPTRAEGGITAEEKVALDKHAALWIERAMRTDPIEPEKIIPAIEGIYAAAGLKKPRVVITPSPLVMAFAYGASAAILYSRKRATTAATRDATSAATYAATDATAATTAATRAATRDATSAATDAATRAATDAAADAAAVAEKGAAAACQEMAGDLGLSCARTWWRAHQGGNMWASYDCYLSAMRDVIGLRLPQHDAYSHWEQAAIHGGFRVMHEEFCIVSDFPEIIRVDDQHRPHCETGPSHRWRDGWALYHWHGVRVPDHWVEDREHLTAADVFKETNAEVRRAGCEILGWDRVLSGIDAKLIDDDGDPFIGVLYRGQIPGAVECGFLKVQCGTGRTFVIPVSPECNSAIEAQAWIAGKPVAKWSQPEVRG